MLITKINLVIALSFKQLAIHLLSLGASFLLRLDAAFVIFIKKMFK